MYFEDHVAAFVRSSTDLEVLIFYQCMEFSLGPVADAISASNAPLRIVLVNLGDGAHDIWNPDNVFGVLPQALSSREGQVIRERGMWVSSDARQLLTTDPVLRFHDDHRLEDILDRTIP